MFEQAATRTATLIDRREFIRTMARGAFMASALLAATGSISTVLSGIAQAAPKPVCENEQGPGCPYHCGPSRCCTYTSGRPAGCNCATGGGGCSTSGGYCLGPDYREYASGYGGCWACYGPYSPCKTGCQCRTVTLCCDCRTSASCNDASGRCISSYVYTQVECYRAGKWTIEKIPA